VDCKPTQSFEAEIQNYTGDDPLDMWDRFLQWAEQVIPPAEKDVLVSMSERLVKNFMNTEKYFNDPRYISYWLKLVNHSTDSFDFYNYMYTRGIGTQSAAFYLAWAHGFETQGSFQAADGIFRKGIENSAKPVDMFLHHYRNFCVRASQNLLSAQADDPMKSPHSSSVNQSRMAENIQNGFQHEPLANSQFVNQGRSTFIPSDLSGGHVGSKPQLVQDNVPNGFTSKSFTLVPNAASSTISNSSHLPHQVDDHSKTPAAPTDLQQAIMYQKNFLFSGEKELCFEENRAKAHIARHQQNQGQKKKQEWKELFVGAKTREVRTLEERLKEQKMQLQLIQEMEQLHCEESFQRASQVSRNATQEISASPPSMMTNGVPLPPAESDWTGNAEVSSLGACAAPILTTSLIRDPLQQSQYTATSTWHDQPQHSFSSTSITVETLPEQTPTGATGYSMRQEHMNRSVYGTKIIPLTGLREGNISGLFVNRSHTPNSSFGLVQATPSKVLPSPTVCTKEALDVIMDMFQAPVIPEQPQEDGEVEAFSQDQMEVQDRDFELFCKKDGNDQSIGILGMNFAPPSTVPFSIFEDDICNDKNGSQKDLVCKLEESKSLGEMPSKNVMSNEPKEVLLLAGSDDQTFWAVHDNKTLPLNSNATQDFAFATHLASTPFHGVQKQPKQDLEDYTRENAVPDADGYPIFVSSLENSIQLFQTRQTSPVEDPGPEPINISSSAVIASADPSPNWLGNNEPPICEKVHLTERQLESCSLTIPEEEYLKPEQSFCCLQDMYNSDLDGESDGMQAETVADTIIVNPWDKDIIAEHLANLPKPVNSYSSCFNWDKNLPTIRPKVSLTLGDKVFHVDYLLGQGAFAHVYQATLLNMNNLSDVRNQQKVMLKVQKPSSQWEFYINTQINARLQRKVHHLYTNIDSGHFFNNGSILVGELYNYGTLLNTVNIYKTQSDKVLPQPLVIYFAIHILYIVEQLHNIGIIHGDIKPDNFILGERFLDSGAASVVDSLSQGLVLIDYGQSIDMKLFPKDAVFMANCKTSGFQCIEMMSEKPWTYQTDYFGIAATIHCMLFGTYMKLKKEQGIWKVNTTFKRSHHTEMWNNFFNTLLYVPSCQALPSLRTLREELVSLFQEQYRNKLRSLRNRLMVLLIENKRSQK
uniref:Mitotic checkpoint serine/threonine-protein kinase BUB1 n=1 Tax=Callorhinchus milii TaxID=7868 RepID=A0A4W3J5S1_CALMI